MISRLTPFIPDRCIGAGLVIYAIVGAAIDYSELASTRHEATGERTEPLNALIFAAFFFVFRLGFASAFLFPTGKSMSGWGGFGMLMAVAAFLLGHHAAAVVFGLIALYMFVRVSGYLGPKPPG
ncbi:MAG TPA: hypothetical protein PLX06_07095 [Fimbriimonadaceae bacterium]|nr:hypothetical protein [Fimbriimonadaceae bacterium]